MPQASETSVSQFVIADRSAVMRANIAEGPDHAVPAEHEDIVIADPAGELADAIQFGEVADFDKTGRDTAMREIAASCRERRTCVFVNRSGFGHRTAYAGIAKRPVRGLRSTMRIASKRLTGNPVLLSDVSVDRGNSRPV